MALRKKSYKKKLYAIFSIRTPYRKNWWFYLIILFICIFLIFGIPLIINEAYKYGKGYYTLWNASDVLSFYAEILSGIITISALIATIYHSKKDTKKQLKYNKSQVKTPFFVIEGTRHPTTGNNSQMQSNYTWQNEFPCRIIKGKFEFSDEEKCFEILLKNIGDGIALVPHCKVDGHLEPEMIKQHIICPDTLISLSCNLQSCFQERYKTPDDFKPGDSNTEFKILLTFYYKNAMGIEFNQRIGISFKLKIESNRVIVIVDEASSQELTNMR